MYEISIYDWLYGSENKMPDYLSRQPIENEEKDKLKINEVSDNELQINSDE